jgi:hypothetical protein
VQLGPGPLHRVPAPDASILRSRLITSIDEEELRLRQTVERLVEELLRGWRDLGAGK